MSTLKFKVSFKVEKNSKEEMINSEPPLGRYRIIMSYTNKDDINSFLNGSKLFSTQNSGQTDVEYLKRELPILKSESSMVNFVKHEVVKKMTEAGMFEEENPEALELIKQIEAITYEDLEIII